MENENKVKQMNPIKKDMYAGVFSGILFLFFFGFSFGIAEKVTTGSVTSRTLPQAISLIGLICSLILIISNAVKYKKELKAGTLVDVYGEKRLWKNIIISFVLMGGYIALIKTLGFILMSIIYLFLQILILTEEKSKKNIIKVAIISIVVPFVLYLPFRYIFKLLIPVGKVFR